MLQDFTAIDFETANCYPTSACSIGIVVVQDGEITEEFSHLIKPEPFYFNKKFIEIHGITPTMVKMPFLYDLWSVIGRYFDTEALVPYRGFDISVLKACLERADLYVRLPESFVPTVVPEVGERFTQL
ncbi:MAG: exonuclease domain-containing protein [Butyricimonas faecalis]